MDDFTKAYYEIAFERDFLKKKGDNFQNLFCEIMELRYPGDFMRTRPWGNLGDKKNDGYLHSKRTLFQVYAPETEMEAKKAIKKIREDFDGAKSYWAEYFDTWVFTHNAQNGLNPPINNLLLELKAAKPPDVSWWGYAELREEMIQLDESALAKLFGIAPSRITMLRVGYENLRTVLAHVARQNMPSNNPILPVPPGKLEYNALSGHVQLLLNVGRQRADKVDQFFREWHDPTYGDQLAQTFTLRYKELKAQGLPPDDIFTELQAFAGGDRRGSAEHEAAVLTILANFFEKCDIFERPPEGT